MLHAHFETYAVDCDGPITRDYVVVMNEAELKGQGEDNYFGDIDFHHRIASMVVNTYTLFQSGKLEVTSGEGYDNPHTKAVLDWSESTEEGGRASHVTICDDPNCDLEANLYRDHRAESMGY